MTFKSPESPASPQVDEIRPQVKSPGSSRLELADYFHGKSVLQRIELYKYYLSYSNLEAFQLDPPKGQMILQMTEREGVAM